MRYRKLGIWGLAVACAGAVSAGEMEGADRSSAASGLPRWEVGLAAGTGYLPDYPGADRSRVRGIVLPMLIYRGPVLRVDDGGIRGRLVNTADWEFDFSATGGFNAKDNARRQGLAPLDYLFGIGPQWIYKGLQTPGGGPTLHLKLRALMSTDFKRIDARGYSFDPELRWRLGHVAATPATLTLSLQPTWASQPLHRYFYGVAPAEASATRPAYAARAGYLGTEVAATLGYRPQRSLYWFVTGRFTSLHGAANAASPLLRERSQFALGAGVVWTPWRSTAPAVD